MRSADKKLLVHMAILHMLVDAASVSTCMQLSLQEAAVFLLLYDSLAFATQPFIGLLADRWGSPQRWAACGLLMTGIGAGLACIPVMAGLSLPGMGLFCILLVGMGNALFHIGGGMASLRMGQGTALAPGVFVGPGALGLTLGMLSSKWATPVLSIWLPLLCICMLAGAVLIFQNTLELPLPSQPKFKPKPSLLCWAILLLLASVFVRSWAVSGMVFPWKTGILPVLLFGCAVAGGKCIGGWIADRMGWALTACGGLLVSLPLLIWGRAIMPLSLLGMLLFNMTMPVTLCALAEAFPGHLGWSFGLAAAVLLPGVLLALSDTGRVLSTTPWMTACVIAASAAAIPIALRLLRTNNKEES